MRAVVFPGVALIAICAVDIHQAFPSVLYSDGAIHTVSSSSDSVIIENATTLNVVSGASVNAPSDTYGIAGDDYSQSALTMTGGSVTGGVFMAGGTAHISNGILNGGIPGSEGLDAFAGRGTDVTISGGTFVGGDSNLIWGAHDAFIAVEGSRVNISGGVFIGGNAGEYAYSAFGLAGASVVLNNGLGSPFSLITGGTFIAGTGGSYGGLSPFALWVGYNSPGFLDLKGGHIAGSFGVEGDSILNIYGYGLTTTIIDSEIDVYSEHITGTLLDGSTLNADALVFQNGQVNLINVPEPSSVILAALGLVGLAAWGWRRRRRPDLPTRLMALLSCVVAVTLAGSRTSSAQTLTTLFSFDGANGAPPEGEVILVGSTLYGMTSGGGTFGDGAVFSIPTSGGTPTILASFDGTNGASPFGGLTLVGSTLFGMTAFGGVFNDGTVFSVPIAGGTPTNLASFNSTSGALPIAGLTLVGSTLFGMTQYGGTQNAGTIFSIPVSGGAVTTLSSFDGISNGGAYGSLIVSGSTLYGMTSTSIISIPLTGGTPTTLHSFGNVPDGFEPVGSLILNGSSLYGMTSAGGAFAHGSIFSIPVTGGAPTILFSFFGFNGGYPFGDLTLSGSTLYGMTTEGGPTGSGTVFSIPITGGAVTTLLIFNGSNGAHPGIGSLVLSGSTLYGTTYEGGDNDEGTVFALSLATPEPSSLAMICIGAIGLAGHGIRRAKRDRS